MTLTETDAGAPPWANGADRLPAALVLPPTHERPPLKYYPDDVVARARALIEGTTRSRGDIARELGISESTLSAWTKKHAWLRPQGAPVQRRLLVPDGAAERRARLTGRLYRAFGGQLAALERKTRRRSGAGEEEKDARTLSVLAKTLETLGNLDRDDGAKSAAPEPADREQFNAELARRIRRWAEGGGAT